MDKKKTLYVSDMDGTLLNSDSVLSGKTTSKLNKLIAQGALFTVATARTPATAVSLMKGVNTNLPFIVMAGCAQWDNVSQQYKRARTLSNESVDKLTEIFARHGNSPFVYYRNGNSITVHHTNNLTEAEKQFIEPRTQTPLKRLVLCDNLHADTSLDGAMLIFSTGKFSALRAIADDIDRLGINCTYNCYHDIFNDEEGFIDIYTKGTTKAAAIKELAEETGAERIVVFGDNLNDIPMMDAADWSVAVDNAFDEVKRHANEVIGSNDTDAVARWIENDFAQEKQEP